MWGALFQAMRLRFCGNRKVDECAKCPLVITCPVASLLSTLKPGSPRGRDVPRPCSELDSLQDTESRPFARGGLGAGGDPHRAIITTPLESKKAAEAALCVAVVAIL